LGAGEGGQALAGIGGGCGQALGAVLAWLGLAVVYDSFIYDIDGFFTLEINTLVIPIMMLQSKPV